MVIGYGITLALSVGLLVLYRFLIKNRAFWMGMLFVCITLVNLGYLMLSLAKSVEFAIFANDVAYLGSVFLSMCMFLTIAKLCGFTVNKRIVIALVILGAVMFFIIATSGLLPWYYKSVSIDTTGGATKLIKEYGVLHPVYLVYLIGYLVAMISCIIYSMVRNKGKSQKIAGFLALVVAINIAVWVVEKFSKWEFEFLAVSYVVSEMILIFIYWTIQDYVLIADIPRYTHEQQVQLGISITSMPMEAKLNKVLGFVKEDTPLAIREREVLELILQNKKRKDIAKELCISENTVKTYTRTLYSKLGVSSRNELFDLILKD